MTVAPAGLDVSGGPATVTFTAVLRDDEEDDAGVQLINEAGWAYDAVVIIGPSQQWIRIGNHDFHQVSGDNHLGTWEAVLTMPQYSQPGEWKAAVVQFRDAANNFTNIIAGDLDPYNGRFQVASNPADTAPPALTSLTYGPYVINTSAADEYVNVALHLTDNLSGVSFAPDLSYAPNITTSLGVTLRSPSGAQCVHWGIGEDCAPLFAVPYTQFTLDGTPQDGIWSGTAFFPQYSEPGIWQITDVTVRDKTFNMVTWSRSQLLDMGYTPEDLELIVIRPSLEKDGTLVPNTGWAGRVTDDVYGETAAIFQPNSDSDFDFDVYPSEPIDVSLHVFDEPLGIPGVYAEGTKFVHVDLDPEPASYPPLPPMGLSIILPLKQPLPARPRAVLDLKRVDPETGTLVPAKWWSRECLSPPCTYSYPTGSIGFTPVLKDGARCFVAVQPPSAPVSCPSGTPQGVQQCGNVAICNYVATFSTLVGVFPEEITVAVDIQPGSDKNPLNTKSKGALPVAILGASDFDVNLIDPATLRFGPSRAPLAHDLTDPIVYAQHHQDVNGDGYVDLVCHFIQQETGVTSSTTEACVSANTYDTGNGPTPVTGCDTVTPIR